MLTTLLGQFQAANVRALLALWFAGVSGFLFATGQVVPVELIAITAVVNTHYFSQRGEEERAKLTYGPEVADLPPPYFEQTSE